ncbi:MAG: hypothetical protein ACLFV2_00335 [Desulfurivibrionaceae bacterium]
MQRQVDMEKSMLTAHRNFMDNLEKSLKILEEDMEEVKALRVSCTKDWRRSTEQIIDELHKYIYSISEPRFASKEDSERIRDLRKKLKNLYIEYAKILEVNAT